MIGHESVICEGLGCHVEIRPQRELGADKWLRDPMVIHHSEPVWYIYVDPAKCNEYGMLVPEEIQRLSQLAERMHRGES